MAPPLGLFLATAAAISVMPPFRAQRGFARHDGYLEVGYLNWPYGYVMVALLVVAVSATFLHASVRGRLDRATAGVLQGLAFAGIAIAVPFFTQLALLPAGEGSPYAVKKYAFGLITLLAVDLCVLVASLVPLSARLPRAQTVLSYVFGVALVVVATYGVFSQPGRGYFTTQMVDLERRVEAVASSGDLGDDRRDYAVELVGSEPWLDYMFHGRNPAPHDRGPLDLYFVGKSGALLRSADQLVTVSSTRYDQAACRSSAPRDALVVVGAECLADDSP